MIKDLENRPMTLEMKELYDEALLCESREETLENSFFVCRKTVTNAKFATKKAYQNFWKCITNTWPDSKKFVATIRKDCSIDFQKKV